MEQVFLDGITGHFNLRKPKGEKPTPIYFVCSIDGKQHKFSIGAKVCPHHWNREKHECIISYRLSELDKHNNSIANERIKSILWSFSEFKSYLCTHIDEIPNKYNVLMKFIGKDMVSKKQQKKFSTIDIIESGFERYYSYVHPSTKPESVEENRGKVNKFEEYIKEKNFDTNTDVFSQGGLNDYKAYLIDEMNTKHTFGISRINQLCGEIAKIINNVLAVDSQYKDYGFQQVKYIPLNDPRKQEDICRFPLLDEEVEAIKNCTVLSGSEPEYRTLFLLQIECGQRFSDMVQLINGKYEIDEDNNKINILTKKEGIYSSIDITPNFRKYLFEEVPNFSYIKIELFNKKTYNEAIKRICKKSGLDRIIKWKDSQGKEKSAKLWEVVVNHDARHTFITNMAKNGIPYDTLCLMTGHADDKMIKQVYATLSQEDKNKKVNEAIHNLNDAVSPIASNDLCYSVFNYVNELIEDDSNYHTDKLSLVLDDEKIYELTKNYLIGKKLSLMAFLKWYTENNENLQLVITEQTIRKKIFDIIRKCLK